MPLARLIVSAVEDAEDLAADLRKRGFALEIVSPDKVPDYPVDLEIRVEEQSAEQALRCAEELSKTEDLHVFIAAGAILDSQRSMIVVPLPEPVPPALEGMAEPELFLPIAAERSSTSQDPWSLPTEDVLDEDSLGENLDLPVIQPSAEEVYAQSQESSFEPLPALDSGVAEHPAHHALAAEEVFPPSDWPIWQPLADNHPEEHTVCETSDLVVSSPQNVRAPFNSRANDPLFWRVAVVASVLAVSTLLLGVSAHRFSPLPHGISSTGLDRGVPFEQTRAESSTVQNIAENTPVLAPVAAPAAELKRVVAYMPVTEQPPSTHLRLRDRPKRFKNPATPPEDDYVAKDTVIRFGRKPDPPRMEAQKKPGIKHYSDLR